MEKSLTTLQKYYIKHQEIIKKRSTENYNNNKQSINFKRLKPETCMCGMIVCHTSMRRHFKSATHQNWVGTIPSPFIINLSKK